MPASPHLCRHRRTFATQMRKRRGMCDNRDMLDNHDPPAGSPAVRAREQDPGRIARQYWPIAAFVGSLALAVVGQLLWDGKAFWPGLACYLAAVTLFLLPFLRFPALAFGEYPEENPRLDAAPLIPRNLLRLLAAAGSLLLALLAFRNFAGNRLDLGFWPWLAAISLFFLAFANRTARKLPAGPARSVPLSLKQLAALVAIVLVGILFHTYRLADIPPEMTSDHAEKLLDVNDVLNGLRPIFFVRNTGREALQFYLTAALVQFTPLALSHLALKAGTALVGLLTIPLTYLFARQEYGRLTALLAAFFLAVSTWHVAITRVGLRFPFTPAFAVPALFFLLRGLRYNRRNDWLLAGAVLGIGLHTYTAMRFVPLLFCVLVLLKAALDALLHLRGRSSGEESSAVSRRFWANAVLSALAALLLFLPLLRYTLEEPDAFWFRAASRFAPGSSAPPPLELWRTFWLNVQNALAAFNWRGDTVPINTIPGARILGLVPAALFVLGIAFLLWRLVRYRQRRDLYLLVALWVLLLPSILSLAFPIENPSVARMAGAVPFVMIIVALPVAALIKRLQALSLPSPARSRRADRLVRLVTALLLAGLLLLTAWDSYRWYFVDYQAHTLRSLWNASQMGEVVRDFLDSGGEPANVYHVPYPHWVDTRNIAISAGHIEWHNTISDLEMLRLHAESPAPRLYLVYPADEPALALLDELFPAAAQTLYRSDREGKDFWVIRVPGAE